MSGIEDLRKKISAYSRAYYRHRLLRGLIMWLAFSLATLIIYLVMEHFGRFASETRQLLFWSFVGLFLFWLGFYVLVPSLRMTNLLKGLEADEVADHINRLEPGLRNKLLNTLSLSKDAVSELHYAALQQKVAQLALYDFTAIIDFKSLRPLMLWVLLPMVFLMLMFTMDQEGRWSDSGKRLVYYNQDFRPPAPFQFLLEGDDYLLARGDRLSIDLRLLGDELPQKVTAQLGNQIKLPQKLSLKDWRLELDNIQEETELHFEANGYQSEAIRIRLYDRPSVGKWTLLVEPPGYTGLDKGAEALSGLHRIPEGSRFVLKADKMNAVKGMQLSLSNEESLLFTGSELEGQISENMAFSIVISNDQDTVSLFDGSRFLVIKDEKPQIAIQQRDSLSETLRRFSIKVDDDYGISKVERIDRKSVV